MTIVKNGDIIKIPLPNNLGNAYLKYIDLLKRNNSAIYPSLAL